VLEVASVEEVKANVAASVDGAQRAVSGIQQVADQLDDSLARLRITAVGSFHPSIATAIAQLEQARSRLDEAQTLARAAMDSADAYRMIV
jgi:molecular chaperone GrpE (heat shock protein)